MGAFQQVRDGTLGWAMRELRGAQKSAAGVPAYTRYVNRPLGRAAAAVAYTLRLSADQVTILSGTVSFVSLVALALFEPSLALGLAVACGLVVGYILDSADGQLARLRRGGSPAGEWLDHVVDSARMPSVHLAVLIGLYRFGGDLPVSYLLIPLGYLLVTVVRFFALILAEQMHRNLESGAMSAPATPSDSALRSLLGLPADFGVLCIAFVVWGNTELFAICYGMLFVANAVLMFASLIRRHRELVNRDGVK